MSLVAMTDAIVTAVRGVSGLRMVEAYDGQFNETDLKRFGAAAPAVLVSNVGFDETEDYGDDLVCNAQWVMSILTQRTSGKPTEASRMNAAQALAETLTVMVRDSNSEGGAWAGESSGTPEKIRARNVASPALDSRNLTMWLLTWTQKCSVTAFDNDALDDLLRLNGEMTLATDITYDVETVVAGAS
jgi:hypothetical protein